MTQRERLTPGESWKYYRTVFCRRNEHSASSNVFLSLIDEIVRLGYSDRLYAGTALDNLVISVRPRPRDRWQTILAIAKGDSVEFRLYPKEGEPEVCTATANEAESTMARLLPRLFASSTTCSSGTNDGKS